MPQRSGPRGPDKAGQALDREEPGQTGWKRGSGQGPRAEQASAAILAGLPPEPPARQKWGKRNADRASLHQGRSVGLRGHRVPADHKRDPQSGRLGRVPRRRRRSADRLVAGRRRRHRAEIFPQGRRAGAPEEGRGGDRPLLAVALGARRGGARRRCPRRSASSASVRPSRCSSGSPAPGPTGAGRAAISIRRATRARSSTSSSTCSRRRWRRRTRRNGSTPACTGPTASTARARATTTSTPFTGKLTKSKSAYEHPQPHACFIQSIADDLVNEGGIMDLWVREARLFKYGSGTGSNFSSLRGEGERLAGGGKSSGLMIVPQDRRPRRRRDQVGRHHAPRRQDGDRRHRPSRHRAVHRLEGDRGAEGRGAGHRLQDQPEAPARDPQGLRELRRLRRRLLRSGEEPGAAPRDQGGAPQPRARQLHQARDPVRQAGLHRHRSSRSTTPTGIRRPISPSPARTPTTRCASPTSSSKPSRPTANWDLTWRTKPGKIAKTVKARAPVGEDRLRRLGVGRSGPAIPLHHQRLAHLPGLGSDHRVEPVLGIHVPRRHRLQSRLDEPARVPAPRTSARASAHLRRRRLRACGPAVDRGARDRRADGAVPVEARSRSAPTNSARSASATPMSAAC